jgi:CheY-like chemotaxis protein
LNPSPAGDPLSSSQSRNEREAGRRRASIVIVDDNPTDVFVIREAILAQRLDLELRVLEDGEEAIGYISHLEEDPEEPCPLLMLLDINLPKNDGFEVLAWLRNTKRGAGLPVIVMTSSGAPADRERSAALGAKLYFQKPSEYAAFLEIGEIVRSYLSPGTF